MADAPESALIELAVGAVAHGGACVARHGGRVVFVRHALPGERVLARITEDRGGRFLRADAVEVLAASPDRVRAPCPYAGPGRCGGCDWQHADAAAQRAMKSDVIREQFRRLAGIDVGPVFSGVAELPGGLLGWRTRVTYAVGRDGQLGLHRHRSAQVERIERCLLGVDGVGDTEALRSRWDGLTAVEVARGDDGSVALLAHRPGPGRQARGRRPPDRVEPIAGPPALSYRVAGRRFQVSAGGFWQVHPAAAPAFAQALLDALGLAAGERVLDLYAGAGALTAALGTAVGPTGAVLGLEMSRVAVADAAANLADLPWAEVRRGRIDAHAISALDTEGTEFDAVVLDPPRAGAGAQVMDAILDRRPRTVGYVSCDPATLARDAAVAVRRGWRVGTLQGFDAFPMTHHVECVLTLLPG